jgi:uncharacterized protein YndB with AHSA1/START domain
MWTVSRQIDAPAMTVWNILTDLDRWPDWGPTVSGAELDEDGPLRLGSRGRVWTPVGVPLPFEVDQFRAGSSWAWEVGGIPATSHGVEPDGEVCRLWMSSPVWAPAYLPVLAIALRRIEGLSRIVLPPKHSE